MKRMQILSVVQFYILFLGMCFVVSPLMAYDDATSNPFMPRLPKIEKKKELEVVNSIKDNFSAEEEYQRRILKEREEMLKREAEINRVEFQKELEIPELAISGIVWNSDKPQAIVNGEVVAIGDVVAEARVVKIAKECVEFDFKGASLIRTP